MRFKEFYLTENVSSLKNAVISLLSSWGKHPIMYRAFDNDQPIVKIDNSSRNPENIKFHRNGTLQSTVLQGLRVKNPVFATVKKPESPTHWQFGTVNILVPPSGCKPIWNPMVFDLGMGHGYMDMDLNDVDPKEIIDGYEQGVPNTHSRNEIILDCPYYYLLNLEAFLNMLGGDVFSVNEPDYKIISDEVLDRMNTYDDVIKVLNSTPS